MKGYTALRCLGRVTKGYWGLHRITSGYEGLQGVTKS